MIQRFETPTDQMVTIIRKSDFQKSINTFQLRRFNRLIEAIINLSTRLFLQK